MILVSNSRFSGSRNPFMTSERLSETYISKNKKAAIRKWIFTSRKYDLPIIAHNLITSGHKRMVLESKSIFFMVKEFMFDIRITFWALDFKNKMATTGNGNFLSLRIAP